MRKTIQIIWPGQEPREITISVTKEDTWMSLVNKITKQDSHFLKILQLENPSIHPPIEYSDPRPWDAMNYIRQIAFR